MKQDQEVGLPAGHLPAVLTVQELEADIVLPLQVEVEDTTGYSWRGHLRQVGLVLICDRDFILFYVCIISRYQKASVSWHKGNNYRHSTMSEHKEAIEA